MCEIRCRTLIYNPRFPGQYFVDRVVLPCGNIRRTDSSGELMNVMRRRVPGAEVLLKRGKWRSTA
jgi:hypothetical protein